VLRNGRTKRKIRADKPFWQIERSMLGNAYTAVCMRLDHNRSLSNAGTRSGMIRAAVQVRRMG
jgi:hypothetical protein